MKNVIIYYLSSLTPLVLLMLFWSLLEPKLALVLLAGYVFIYRTILDGRRLYQKGLISKDEIWKVSFNGARMENFKALYLKK